MSYETVKRLLSAYAGLCAVVVAFVAFYLAREDMVYCWDYYGYHGQWLECVHLWRDKGLLAVLCRVGESIRMADYNLAAVVPILPWGRLFGCSRMSYLAAMACIYFVPAGIVMAEFIFSQLKSSFASLRRRVVYAVVFVSAPLWCPFLRGFVDVAVVLPLTAATWLFVKDSFVSRRRIGAAFVLGLCLYLGFLFRRWMAFSLVAFAFAAVPFVGLDLCRAAVGWRRKITNMFLHGLCAWVAFIVPMIVLQWDKVVSIVETDYSVAHEPWATSFCDSLSFLGWYLNWYVLVGLVLGCAVFLVMKCRSNRAFLFCGLYVLVYLVSFLRLEMMGRHHAYGMLPHLLLLLAGGGLAVGRAFSRWHGLGTCLLRMAYVGLVALWFCSFVMLSGRRSDKLWSPLGKDVSGIVYTSFPFRYTAASDLIRFAFLFEALLEKHPASRYFNMGSGFSVNASQHVALAQQVNESLGSGCLPLTISQALMPCIVDSIMPRFPEDMLEADFLIIVSPFEGHTDLRYHQIPFQLGKALVTGKNVGMAYERVLEQPLLPQVVDGWEELRDPSVVAQLRESGRYVDYVSGEHVAPTNMTLIVYRRLRSVGQAERQELANEMLKNLHPPLKEPFSRSILGLTFFSGAEMEYDRSSNIELVRKISGNAVAMHPWTTPSTLTLALNGRYRSVRMSFASQNVMGDVVFSVRRDGEEFRREHIAGGASSDFELPLSGVNTLVFQVDCNGSVNCDSCVLTVTDILMEGE